LDESSMTGKVVVHPNAVLGTFPRLVQSARLNQSLVNKTMGYTFGKWNFAMVYR